MTSDKIEIKTEVQVADEQGNYYAVDNILELKAALLDRGSNVDEFAIMGNVRHLGWVNLGDIRKREGEVNTIWDANQKLKDLIYAIHSQNARMQGKPVQGEGYMDKIFLPVYRTRLWNGGIHATDHYVNRWNLAFMIIEEIPEDGKRPWTGDVRFEPTHHLKSVDHISGTQLILARGTERGCMTAMFTFVNPLHDHRTGAARVDIVLGDTSDDGT